LGEANDTSEAELHLIRAMRMAVHFYHYGFVFDVKGAAQIVRTDQLDGYLACLNAFCTTAEWTYIL
jgi:hypothetical protein